MDEHRSPRRIGLWIAIALFTAQCFVTMSLWFHFRLAEYDGALRIYAEVHPLPGGTAPLRVGVFSRHSGRLLADVPFTLRVEGATSDGQVEEVRPVERNEPALYRVRVGSTPAVVVAAYDPPGAARREVRLVLEPDEPSPAPWTEAATWRPVSRTGRTAHDQLESPGLVWEAPVEGSGAAAGSGDGVPPPGSSAVVVGAAPEGAIASRFVDSSVLLRVSAPDGAPLANRTVALRRLDSPTGPDVSLVTDALGLVSMPVRPEGIERWSVTVDGGATRVFRLVPSWDGIQVRVPSTVPASVPLDVELSSQRGFGAWNLDVHCDGRHVSSSIVPARAGASRVRLDVAWPVLPDTGFRLCWIQASDRPFSPDPQRSASWFVLARSAEAGEAAVDALLATLASVGPEPERQHAGAAARSARARATAEERDRHARYLLSTVDPPFRPLTIAHDDRDALVGDFEEERRTILRTILWVLVVDAVVMLVGLVSVLAVGIRGNRRRMRQAIVDAADELTEAGGDPEAATDAGDGDLGPLYVFAGLAIVASGFGGLMLLIHYTTR